MLVSENNTSYGKDLGDIRLLETLLPELADVDGIERIRVSYLQPAEMRPGLIDVLTSTPKVAPYFDLSSQHSSPSVLRTMRRFGDTDRFLELLDTIRNKAPEAGARSNFIVGFPGETEADLAELERFLTGARLDAIGVFGYSDEEGTEGGRLREQARRRHHRGAPGPYLPAGRGADLAAGRGARRRDPPGAGGVRGVGGRRRGRDRACGPPGSRNGWPGGLHHTRGTRARRGAGRRQRQWPRHRGPGHERHEELGDGGRAR
ncbi:tRNA-2-methylthio-N(6)-dimethylallyladenosine synthase [Streptomyces griseus]